MKEKKTTHKEIRRKITSDKTVGKKGSTWWRKNWVPTKRRQCQVSKAPIKEHQSNQWNGTKSHAVPIKIKKKVPPD